MTENLHKTKKKNNKIKYLIDRNSTQNKKNKN